MCSLETKTTNLWPIFELIGLKKLSLNMDLKII